MGRKTFRNGSCVELKLGRFLSACAMSVLLFLGQTASLLGNPTGGAVVAGSATIDTSGNTVTVKQNSGTTIINWQNFSISAGELTKFVQPSSSSMALNRVISGNPSAIYGTLSSNGQIFLINPNGILVGAGGVVNTAGFTASTRDIANADFLSGNLHFTGDSNAGVENLGTINALGGNIYLIGNTVDNQGTLNAPQGTAGLAAATDVTLTQAGADNLFIQPYANASSNPTDAKLTVVSNSGKITAATAELKAANGNMYALAINNRGSIVATTVKHQGGHIYLMADSGTVENSGTLNASATAAGGQGGTVTLKSTAGTVIHTGKILAQGGQGGIGGNVDVSGESVQLGGTVDTTAPGGTTGNLLIDPVTLDVIAGGSTSSITASSVDNGYIDSLLEVNNLTLNAGNNITVSSTIGWAAATTLTLSTNNIGSTIDINALILGEEGGLTIKTAGLNDVISATAGVKVGSFILQNGFWNQNTPNLPTFVATQDFELQGGTFLRVTGGDGSTGNPYQLVGPFDLQGIGSPSGELLNSSFILENDVDASSTATWNGGAGFVPIGGNLENNSTPAFTGTFDGNGHTINGLTVNAPSGVFVGLFGSVIGGTVENVGVTNVNITGDGDVGGLVGYNLGGTLTHDYTTGSVTLSSGSVYNDAGGLAGDNESNSTTGTINNDFSTASVTTVEGFNVGGLVGINDALVENSYSKGALVGGAGVNGIGGLVGNNYNNGVISKSYSTGAVTTTNASAAVGGLAGDNSGNIEMSFATGAVSDSGANGNFIGGLVGDNENTISLSYATGSVTSTSTSEYTGGLLGFNGGTISNVYATGSVSGAGFVGGLVGSNGNVAITDAYSTGLVSGTSNVGGLVGFNNIAGTVVDSFWNTTTSGQSTSQGGMAATTAQLQSQTYIHANAPSFNFTSTWTTAGSTTAPLLQALSVSLSGTTVGAADTVDLIELGNVVSTTAASGGSYTFYVPDDVLANGALLTDATSNHAASYYVAGLIPSAAVTGVNLGANALNVLGTGLANNAALGNALGTLSGVGANYSVSSGNLTTNSGVSMTIGTSYALDGDITATSAALNTTSTSQLMGHTNVTLTASSMNLAGSLADAATVTLNSSGAIVAGGSVDVDGFTLENGTWTEVVGQNGLSVLPDFNADNFVLENSSTFERFAGGTGTTANPYQIADEYGLQGLGSPSNSLLFSSAELVNDIDASDTSAWNGNAGFAPIGSLDFPYGATFNGQGFTISNLDIYLPNASVAGLFAATRPAAVIENVGLVNASVTANSNVGALVGMNFGTIENSSAGGSVMSFYDGFNGSNIGGLVGDNVGLISGSSSSATVMASTADSVGGLVGNNDNNVNPGQITGSYATGSVTGATYVGGLAGFNNFEASIQSSHATGAVSGTSDAGGLLGLNEEAQVNLSYATGSVSGTGSAIGGLVGYNDTGASSIDNSYSTGSVTGASGTSAVGGLLGYNNNGALQTIYATGSVTGLGTGDTEYGGLVGYNPGGTIRKGYATGAVTVGANSTYVGGLVGSSPAYIANSYSTGPVTVGANSSNIGGLTGFGGGTIFNAYTTSSVTAGSGSFMVGGFMGSADPGLSIYGSFWDTDTAEQTVGVANDPNGVTVGNVAGLTTAQMESASYIDSLYPGTWAITTGDTLGDTNIPQITGIPNTAAPGFDFLNGTAYSDSGTTVDLLGETIDLFYDGTELGATTTNATGGFTFSIPTADLTQGILLADTSNHGGNTYYQANSPAGTISGVDIWGDTIRVMADMASNSALATVAGGLSSGIDYGVSGNNIVSNNNGFLILSNYTLDGNMSGTFINTASSASVNSPLSSVTLSATSMYLAGSLTSSGTVTLNAGDPILASGNVNVAGFILGNGTWTQIVGQNGLTALPEFKDSGDFELQGGTFERFAGGLGTAVNPYQIVDIHGLQGIGSGSLYTDSFVLDNDIKGEATANWNSGAGFVPIANFSGTFNGQGNTISGLTIALPGSDNVGLFGATGPSSLIENVGLTNSTITGSSNVGVLVALNGGTVESSYASGSLSGIGEVGGLVGQNNGTVDSSYATTAVNGVDNFGGLVGYNYYGLVENSYATGRVTGSNGLSGISGGGYFGIGGLVGFMQGGTVESSYSTGTVNGGNGVGFSGNWGVGGLVGLNDSGLVETSNASGSVTGTINTSGSNGTGGLVGYNLGTIETSYALGPVTEGGVTTGTVSVGGLAGYNANTITTSYATGAVNGTTLVGGLVGLNDIDGTISLSYANGAVTGGSQYAGGLVGQNPGTVDMSYATGAVSGLNYVGGLVGQGSGSVKLSFATGAVSGSYDIGGLMGENDGLLQSSYTLGAVTAASASTSVGGVVGYNSGSGTVETTYSTGAVTAGSGSNYVGGVVGFNSGAVQASYWANNVGTNGSLSTVGSENGSIDTYSSGVNLANMSQAATFQPQGTGVPYWDFTSIWTTNGDTTAPVLQALSTTLSGTALGTNDAIQLVGQGTLLGTTNASGGTYSFFVPDNVVTSGALLVDESGTYTANYYVAGAIPGSTITGVNFGNSYNLGILGTGVANNTGLANAVGTTGLGNYSVSGNNLTTFGGVDMTIGANYQLDGSIDVGGQLVTTASSLLTGTADVTLAANGMTLNGGIVDSTTVRFDSQSQIIANGSVQVSGFILQNGNWSQIVGQNGLGVLPAFNATNDFELQGDSTFERFTGGTGTAVDPYQIADVYGLQGIASPSNAFMSSSFNLVGDIDATSTATWNGGAGFVPIGSGSTPFNGTLNGQGNTINGLTIDEPFTSNIGLFGLAGSSAVIENLAVTNVQVIGAQQVGALVGTNGGEISNVSSSGSVGGNGDGSNVGGLVGLNNGTISFSSSSAAAGSTTSNLGGLVGNNDGEIDHSYSTGQVSGILYVGGLVGDNNGTVNTSYSTSAVSGNQYLGGLVGFNGDGSLTDVYSTGAVTGTGAADVGGLVGVNESTISNAYTTSVVAVDGTEVGGFVGVNFGTITNGFWDVDTAITPLGVGSDSTNTTAGVLAATTTQLETQSYFTANAPGWDFTNTWSTKGDTHLPQLAGLPTTPAPVLNLEPLSGTTYLGDGVTPSPGALVNLVYNGSLLATTTADSSGDYTFNVAASLIAGGIVLTDVNDRSNTYLQSANANGDITGINLTGSTLTVRGDTVSNTALGAATGEMGIFGSPLINYSVGTDSSGMSLTSNPGIGISIQDNFADDGNISYYTLDGNITASGPLITSLNSTLSSTLNSTITLTGSRIGLNGVISTQGELDLVSTAGDIDGYNATITAPNAVFTSAGDVDLTETGGYIAFGGSVSASEGAGFIDIANGATITANNADITASGPLLLDNSTITLNDGNFTGTGNGFLNNASGMADGIDVFSTTINAQGGTITLTGTGGYTSNPDVGPDGGYVGGDGVVLSQSNLQTSGSGDITITGTYSNNITTYGSSGNTPGVTGVAFVSPGDGASTGVTLSVAQGAISVTGTVSAGTDGDGNSPQNSGGTTGIYIDGGTTIQATDVGGTVTLTGSTAGSTSYDNGPGEFGDQNEGIAINSYSDEGDTTQISVAAEGSLTINGTGGTVDSTYATSFNNTGEAEGLDISLGTVISGGNGATLSLTGNGGAAITNDGGTAASGTSYTGSADGLVIGDNNGNGGTTQITVGDGGSIALIGNGGTMDISNDAAAGPNQNPSVGGVQIHRSTQVTADGSATITITGTGGTVAYGTSLIGSAIGVNIGGGDNDETGDLTLISSNTGSITINGTGGTTPNLGTGVVVAGFNGNVGEVESTSGNIYITGTGGAGYTGTGTITTLTGGEPYVPNYGVGLVDAATLETGNGGTISLTGTGGANSAGVGTTEITDIPTLDSAPVSPSIMSSGLLTVTSLTGSDILLESTLIGAGDVTLNSAGNIAITETELDQTGTLTVSATGITTDTAGVDVGTFLLQGGTWSQIAGVNVTTLPLFTVANDFELQGGTFARFAGIDTANGNADEIADIYGLQGLASPSGALLGANAELVANIDASTTSEASWNGASGFIPIGTDASSFLGTFNGAGYTISSLSIGFPGSGSIGLFGATGSGATIENVALLGETIYGLTNVGALVGTNGGTVENSYSTGMVNGSPGGATIGGLVGFNSGTVETSYSTATVTGGSGASGVGGLVGENDGTVETSYANATVSGAYDIGGLVGANNASVGSSYAAGSVTGSGQVGGLIGGNAGPVSNAYSTASVTGLNGSNDVGGLVGYNSNTISNAYSTGAVTGGSGSTNIGGLAGGNAGEFNNSFWTLDTAGVTLGVGSDPTNTTPGVTAATTSLLLSQNYILTNSTSPSPFDFTPGTGIWGSDGVTNTGSGAVQVNNGLPYFQWQYATPVAVVANDQSVTYGSSIDTNDYSVLPGSATLSNYVSGPVSVTSPVTNTNDVGTYAGVITFGNTVQPNVGVTVEQVIGDQTITPAALTITANSTGKTYGNAVTFTGTEYTASNLQNGETVGTVTLASTGAAAFANVSGSPYTITASNATDGTFNPANYDITYVSGLLTINPAALTITTTNANSTYGTVPSVSGNYTDNPIAGDTNPIFTTAPTVGTTATQFSSVAGGPYAITASGAVSSNYTITYNNVGQLTVNPAALTITTTSASTTYGNPVPSVSGNYTVNSIAGDPNAVFTTAPTVGTAATQYSTVAGGPYAITASGAVAANYTVTYSNVGQLTVNPAAMTVTTISASTTYGNTLPDLSANYYNTSVPGDPNAVFTTTPTVGTAATQFSTVAGGPYAITASGAVAPNYTITYVNSGALTVNPAPLTITTTNTTTTYGTIPDLSSSFTDTSVAGDPNPVYSTAPTITTTATATSPVAGSPCPITASGAVAPNYTITYNNTGVLIVNPAQLTITANDDNQTYSGSAYSGGNGVTYLGFVNNETPASLPGTLAYSGTSQGAVNAGNYTIVPGGYTTGNYTYVYNNGQLAINQAPLTIAANADGKVYDTNAYSGGNGVTYNGFVGDDSTASLGGGLAYSGTSQGAVNAGVYTITPGGYTSQNYAITYVDAPLTVAPAPLTITGVETVDKPYDGFTTASLNLSDTSLSGALGEDSVSVDPNSYAANFASSMAGTQIPVNVSYIGLTGSSAGNYVVVPPTGLFADITGVSNQPPPPPPPPLPVPPPVTPAPISNNNTPPPVVVPPPGNGNTQGGAGDITAVVTSSSDSGTVNSDDVAQINNGGVNNANNPVATSTISQALSPATEQGLQSALQTAFGGGGFGDANTSTASPSTDVASDDSQETILEAGDVVSIKGGKVNKNIPLTEVPPELKQALGNLVFNGLQPMPGAGQ
jgi:filamentous hemagglutinin family protein